MRHALSVVKTEKVFCILFLLFASPLLREATDRNFFLFCEGCMGDNVRQRAAGISSSIARTV